MLLSRLIRKTRIHSALISVVGATAMLSGCGSDVAVSYDPSLYDPEAPVISGCGDPEEGTPEALGKALYDAQCLVCHDEQGQSAVPAWVIDDDLQATDPNDSTVVYTELYDIIYYTMPLGAADSCQDADSCAANIWAFMKTWGEDCDTGDTGQ